MQRELRGTILQVTFTASAEVRTKPPMRLGGDVSRWRVVSRRVKQHTPMLGREEAALRCWRGMHQRALIGIAEERLRELRAAVALGIASLGL